jgi:hypothetical protein
VAMQILRHGQIAMSMEVCSEVPAAETRSALKRLGRQLHGELALLYGHWKGPVLCSKSALEVELRGFEPLTPSMRTERSGQQTCCLTALPHVRGD